MAAGNLRLARRWRQLAFVQNASLGTSCTNEGGAACYSTGAPDYVCPSGTTGLASCPTSNVIGWCTLVASQRGPDGGIVIYSTIEYFYCTGINSMTSAFQLQSDCTKSASTILERFDGAR